MTALIPDDCVCELCDYLNSQLTTSRVLYDNNGDVEWDDSQTVLGDIQPDVRIFQYEDKPKTYKGCYIAINALPFVYGLAVNDKLRININIHVPSMSDGTLYRKKFKKLKDFILDSIPLESACEDGEMLKLESNVYYCITNISQPRKDIDNTHYVNFQIKAITNNI